MLNFRQFEAGPDPSGRTYRVLFQWMQTAIALRHSDTVDVKFLLESGGHRIPKTVALPHPALVELAGSMQRPLADAWCSRLAAAHLLHLVATGEDLEKDLVTATPERLAVYAGEVEREEREAIRKRASGGRE